MSKYNKKLVYLLLTILTLINSNSTYANTKNRTIKILGDYTQIINPIISASIALEEKGLGHFAIIYGQSIGASYVIKGVSSATKWKLSKRPQSNNYQGMPSAHTNSAWIAASYVRTFSDDYKYASIPLYLAAAFTSYSRVHAKAHTTTQVVAGAALAEIVTYVNSQFNWSNEYRSININLDKKHASMEFIFRL